MRRPGRIGLRRLLLLALLAIGGLVALLRTPRAAEEACTLARRHLPRALGLDVGIGSCAIDPLTQTVRLKGVSLFPRGGETPILVADEAEVSLGSVQPFLGRVDLDQIRVVHPRVMLDLSRPVEPKAKGACNLEALERLAIERMEITDAEVHLQLPGGRAARIEGADLAWRRRRGVAEVQLRAARGGFTARPGAEFELTQLEVNASFDPDDQRVVVTRAEVAIEGMTVEGSGELQRLCDPEVTAEANAFVPLGALSRALGLREEVGGHLWARVAIEGPLSEPLVSADVAGSDVAIGRYRPGGFDARVTFTSRELRIDSFESAAGAGVVRAKGSLGLTPRLPLLVDAELDRAEFGPVLQKLGVQGPWVNFPATGRARATGNLLPAVALEGDAALKLGAFVLWDRAYDSPTPGGDLILEFSGADVSTNLRFQKDRIEFVGARVQGRRSRLFADATLYFASQRGLSIRGEAQALDLSELGHIAGIRWSGMGAAQFEIAGPYSDPRIEAAVSLRDFDFWRLSLGVVQGQVTFADDVLSFPAVTGQKGRTQYHGGVALRFGKPGMHLKAKVRIPEGRTEDVVDVLMPMHENVEVFDDVLDGEIAGTVDFDAPMKKFAGTIALDLENTRYYGRRLGGGRATLRFVNGDYLQLEPMTLRGPLGVTRADGRWTFDGPLDFRFRVLGALAEVLGPERARKLGASGVLTLDGSVGGDTDVWKIDADLTSPRLTFAGKEMGEMRLAGKMVGRDLTVTGRAFQGGDTTLQLRVKEPYPWSLFAAVQVPEIRPLLPQGAISKGVSGSLSGRVEAKGNLKNRNSLEARAQVDRFTLTRGDFSGANDGRIDLAWKAGTLRVESFGFKGPNTALSVAGSVGEDLDLGVHGTFDMRLLESFVPQLERTAGRVEITAAASGTFAQPRFAGTASLSEGRLSVRDQPISMRGLGGRVEFSDNRVLVQEVHGALNDGRVALDGDLRLERFTPKMVQLRLQLDEVPFRPVEDLFLVTDGELHLAGRPDALLLSGDLDVRELLYQKPLVLEALLTDLRSARGVVPPDAPRKEFLNFDVAIHGSGNLRVDNNLAKGRLRGDLRLTGSNVRPGLLGTIEAREGAEIYFRNNTFAVTQGIVEFKERREIDPVFDLHAQTTAREYVVNLHAFGRVRDPQLVLSADPALAEADILSLLTIGITSRDKSDTRSTVESMAYEAVFTATGLDRQVQRFLPKNPLLRDLSFHISSSYNESSGTLVPTAQVESKFITDRLKLGMSQPVGQGRGTRAQAEYRFDDRLSGQLQWDNERDEELPNFGVDLKLRWEME